MVVRSMERLEIQGNGKTLNASARRKINLDFIKNLPLEGLEFEKKEKMLFLYQTASKEDIYLQYPGKESVRETNPNIHDFRPKIYINGKKGEDLSFGAVWESFFDLLKIHSVKDKDFLIAIDYLITLFYKSAYLMDFIEYKNPSIPSAFIEDGKFQGFNKERYQSPILLYNIELHKEMLTFVQEKIGNLSGMSVEAFILYNDILGWNEDFKYYMKEVEKGNEWANATGKPNTLLTHISILGYIRGEFKMSDILNRFVRSRGVSAPTSAELRKLFEDYINPQITELS